MSDLVKRLDIKAGVMEMGEKIAWGSDTALMREAIYRIEVLESALKKIRDSDYVITLPDRMDAVRDIARKALGDV